MLDPQLLRENPEFVAEQLAKRGTRFDAKAYRALETRRKALQVATEQLQQDRNLRSKAFGLAKSKGEPTAPIQEEVQKISTQLEEHKTALEALLLEIQQIVEQLPNLPHVTVPEGLSEADNVEVRREGTPKTFSFVPRSHDELGEAIGQMDFAMAAKITGARFVVMRGSLAKLHRALTQWMLDVHTSEHTYTEVYVPYLVNQASLYGTGQLPKFEADLFKVNGEPSYYLTSTGEVPVTNMVRDEIIPMDQLPLRFVCHSPCFRSEAGSYGKDTKGMIRQHQFEKVELVWVTTPETSYDALEQLVGHAEVILQRLDLPYRVVSLCTGDLGNAAKTYDLEVWLPSQNKYREISSCSNMEAFQARRMQTRFRCPETGKPKLVHTLNGSGLAVGRTLVAIMENYQDESGNITIPTVLQPYMGGKTVIGR
jgi:seryl-tRNA synthetase